METEFQRIRGNLAIFHSSVYQGDSVRLRVCMVWVRSPHHAFESGEVAKRHYIWYKMGPALSMLEESPLLY